jgi:hypothetical protein
MSTTQEATEAHAEARRMSEVNATVYMVDPDTLEVMYVEDYAGDVDAGVIYYCGSAYRKED